MKLKEELEQRWYLHQYTHEEVFEIFENGWKKFYLWVDLSADSMTIGNFVALMMAIRIMMRWNTWYLLVWWATSTIGNPSGKDNERPILTDEQLLHNQNWISDQFAKLCSNIESISWKKLDFTIVNNKDFFVDMNALEYLKEVGRYITVNWMLNKDIVKKRVTDPDKFISYAEFSYMLIMGYDFFHLFKNEDVIMEVWWSDERDWIITWIELISKKINETAYWITNKLIVDSNGKKFWKSEWNAIRLDPKKNHPYVCYNYFMNSADEDVERYLKLFTLLEFDEINKIIQSHNTDVSKREGQSKLSYLVTQMIYWTKSADLCIMIKDTLFGSANAVEKITSMSEEEMIAINQSTWWNIWSNMRILEAIVATWLCESNAEAKKAIKSNAISLNEIKVSDVWYEISDQDRINWKILLLRKGKKTYKTLLKS